MTDTEKLLRIRQDAYNILVFWNPSIALQQAAVERCPEILPLLAPVNPEVVDMAAKVCPSYLAEAP